MTPLTPEQGLAAFERNAGRIVNLLADADLDASVPSCPGWTLSDLVIHVGGVHEWARHAIVEGNPDGEEKGPGSIDRDTLTAWYQKAATDLADTLRTTEPGAAAWTFGPKPRTAAFWIRRQAHETAVHLWDARRSQAGRPFSPAGQPSPAGDDNWRSLQRGRAEILDPELAADGIDEVVTMFFPRQVRLGRIAPLTSALRLQAGPDSWLLAGDGTRPGRQPQVHDHGEGDVTVSGPADAVLLLLWNRTGLDDDRLTVTGDADAARAVLKAGIVP